MTVLTVTRHLAARVSGQVFSLASWLLPLAGVLLLGAGPLFGFHSFAINGGSMQPAIPFGALVVAGPGEPVAGDVITLRQPNDVNVTHRVTRVEGNLYFTAGDANEHPDPQPTARANIVGKVHFYLPGGGYLLGMLTDPWGIVSLISAWGSVAIWPRKPAGQLLAAAAAPAAMAHSNAPFVSPETAPEAVALVLAETMGFVQPAVAPNIALLAPLGSSAGTMDFVQPAWAPKIASLAQTEPAWPASDTLAYTVSAPVEASLPELSRSGLSRPEPELPELNLPELNLPELDLPELDLPKLPLAAFKPINQIQRAGRYS